MNAYKPSSEKLAELLAKARAAKSLPTVATPLELQTLETDLQISATGVGRTGETITYNREQLAFINLAAKGESCILIGAAGTGKTTCMRGTITALIQSGAAGILDGSDHKYLPPTGAPGIVCVSFTRRAVNNLRRNLPAEMKDNCITIHKLLEYEPVYYEIFDEETGQMRKTMKFEATRSRYKPLPSSIHTVIIEEASMVSVELMKEINDALPYKVQFIFLGDIQQLPPVFGSAILGYKMLELPTIELAQVYRQALESPIIRLAHRILSGNHISAKEYPAWEVAGQLKLHPWKKKLSSDLALSTAAKFFTSSITAGVYNSDTDIILIPYNKAFGTDELNKHIANFIAKKSEQLTYEIVAGFNKVYLSVGDKVLYDKEDAKILEIKQNSAYFGVAAKSASKTLDYWGHDTQESKSNSDHSSLSEQSIDYLLEQAASIEGDSDKLRVASHTVLLEILDSGKQITLTSAAEINNILLGYAITVHKAQGSEWDKVFLVLHQSHATMLQRELLYTAVTRAKKELYVICEPESFTKGIISQRIKGNTLREKAEYFKGKTERAT